MEIFRDRVRAGERVIGTFVKTTSPQIVEVLGHTKLDFAVLDAEHAPFGRETLSLALGVANPAALSLLVRLPDHGAAFINACLDMGADGILVPHVRSLADVEAIADAAKFARGRRGFSPSSRAGSYGTVSAAAFRAKADTTSSIWCQIEDAEALDAIDEIAAHKAVDCLFIGPADLSLSLGLDGPDDVRLEPAITRIVEAGKRHGRPIGLFVPNATHIPAALARHISILVCGSDQSMLLEGVSCLISAMADARANIVQ